MKIKAVIVIQKYWRGIKTRRQFTKQKGMRAAQTIQEVKAGKRDLKKEEIDFYRKALNAYQKKKRFEGSLQSLDTSNSNNHMNPSLVSLKNIFNQTEGRL
jgi:hypothetical protein